MLQTAFTQLVGCKAPIQLAPMGVLNTPQLVAAVTEAGGMGMVGLPGAPARAVIDALEACGAHAKGPFGFNVLVPFLDLEVVEAAAARCRCVDFYHGAVDGSLVERVHAAGALAAWQVGATDQARAAVDAGCDFLVVRGTEGGGRMYGSRGLWPMLFEVLSAVDIPVLATGGIADGRGLAAALAAGAAGVRLGTRFVATPESNAHQSYKDAIVAETETVLTDAFKTGWPDEVTRSRVLRRAYERAAALPDNAAVARMKIGPDTEEVPRFGFPPPTATASGDVTAMAMYAGESAALITSVEPAGEIVTQIARQAEELLRSATPDRHVRS
ncbi:NAD(P)H-dependent flavin oxidoreductase [Streptantibioticus ferralitis]|uniref:Nitronate monooxygenase n=1 Tax=Streptantibioticus ferralitis TaxID=236510 RepID=A0ABT5Z518_9ACTN|nr:nitronate monooxygenase [Streptantibioticus ferralitis]MDF2258873.1 nitronate monooxygenase [Streptantibioticus ferralitis]